MRVFHRHLRIQLCRLALLLLAGGQNWLAQPAYADDSQASDRELLAILGRVDWQDAAARQDALTQIKALGSGAACTIFAVYSGGELDLAGADAATAALLSAVNVRQTLLASLSTWPPKEVSRRILSRLTSSATIEELLVAVKLHGEFATSACLSNVFDLLARIESVHYQRPYVRSLLATALASICDRDSAAVSALREGYANWPGELQGIAVDALANCDEPQAVLCLVTLLEAGSPQAQNLLRALSSPKPRHADALQQPVLEVLRPYLQHAERALVREAACALGRWRDETAIETLIDMCAGTDAGLARVAECALYDISGIKLAGGSDGWEVWWSREQRWYHEALPSTLNRLQSDQAGQVVAALRELAEHRPYFRELAPHIQALLSDANAAVALAASAALTRLNALQALPDWAELLDDSRELLRQAAHRALLDLGRTTLPARAQDWRAWIRT